MASLQLHRSYLLSHLTLVAPVTYLTVAVIVGGIVEWRERIKLGALILGAAWASRRVAHVVGNAVDKESLRMEPIQVV